MKNNISLNQLKELALKYPNDMQLGKQVRRLVWELVDVEEVTEQGWNGEL